MSYTIFCCVGSFVVALITQYAVTRKHMIAGGISDPDDGADGLIPILVGFFAGLIAIFAACFWSQWLVAPWGLVGIIANFPAVPLAGKIIRGTFKFVGWVFDCLT
jgi:hypothetical protein